MAKPLVVVESPAKAKTISKFLGSDFDVRASIGHIADLPSKGLAVDVDNGFKPTYELTDRGRELADIAGRIAANPAPQLLWTKELLTENALERDVHAVQERELSVISRCFASPEHAEAVTAFIEKRPPQFPPRGSTS